MSERMSEVLSMLFECLDLWVLPVASDREGCLVIYTEKGWLSVWTDAWSVILQPILPV